MRCHLKDLKKRANKILEAKFTEEENAAAVIQKDVTFRPATVVFPYSP